MWTSVGQLVGGRTTCLASFDDGTGPALYMGGTAQPGTNYIAKLVGNTWTILDGGATGPGLGGSNFPSVCGMAQVLPTSNTWTILDGGATGPGLGGSNFPSVFGMKVWGNGLYVGGNFSQINNIAAAGL